MVYALLSTFLREALETDLLDDDIRDVPAAMSAVSVYLSEDFALARVIWTDKNSHWRRRNSFWRKSWPSAEFQREGLDHGEISFCRRYSRNAEYPGGEAGQVLHNRALSDATRSGQAVGSGRSLRESGRCALRQFLADRRGGTTPSTVHSIE